MEPTIRASTTFVLNLWDFLNQDLDLRVFDEETAK